MPVIPQPYTQYGGIWKLNAASAAQGAGTWPVPPAPHLFSWGVNNYGQLGLGNTTLYSSPKQVGSLTNWYYLQQGSSSRNNFSVKTDGSLWGWGYGNNGNIGAGGINNYSSPKQVGSLTNWSIVSACESSTVAVKTDGTIWFWGYGGYGQNGQNNLTNYSSPKQIGALTNWSYASIGINHVCAVKADGTLWAWGTNNVGQLGLNNGGANVSSPNQIGSLTNWASVYCGRFCTFSTKTDGTLWAWGYNGQGQLGLGNTTIYSSPKQIGVLTNWLKVAAGYYGSSFAIKTDGTLWSWGQNDVGQLGLGNRTYYSSPKQVGSLTNWSFVSPGSKHVAAIKTDSTLWSWGQNANGELGLGNRTLYSSPKQVGSLTSWLAISATYASTIGIAKT